MLSSCVRFYAAFVLCKSVIFVDMGSLKRQKNITMNLLVSGYNSNISSGLHKKVHGRTASGAIWNSFKYSTVRA